MRIFASPAFPEASSHLQAAQAGIAPHTATMSPAEYGTTTMDLALHGPELKTLDPYLADWHRRVVPTLGHFPVRTITNGAIDRTVHGWIADEQSRSTVKNSPAILVRVMEQAIRDGLITINPARITGRQREYKQAEDELDNPRALARPDWPTLLRLAQALIDRSHDHYQGRERSRRLRRRDRRPHQRSLRGTRRRHRQPHLDLDPPPPDHPRTPADSPTRTPKANQSRPCPHHPPQPRPHPHQPRRPARPRTPPLDRVVPTWSPGVPVSSGSHTASAVGGHERADEFGHRRGSGLHKRLEHIAHGADRAGRFGKNGVRLVQLHEFPPHGQGAGSEGPHSRKIPQP
ncbi:hypothetical protein [Streptomyces sp. NPDC051662]|uniref:hypothetical protein n=1 Tax=Streptomyces sp. NPDC051662 TaxID=3154750 RepID=UPI00343F58B0